MLHLTDRRIADLARRRLDPAAQAGLVADLGLDVLHDALDGLVRAIHDSRATADPSKFETALASAVCFREYVRVAKAHQRDVAAATHRARLEVIGQIADGAEDAAALAAAALRLPAPEPLSDVDAWARVHDAPTSQIVALSHGDLDSDRLQQLTGTRLATLATHARVAEQTQWARATQMGSDDPDTQRRWASRHFALQALRDRLGADAARSEGLPTVSPRAARHLLTGIADRTCRDPQAAARAALRLDEPAVDLDAAMDPDAARDVVLAAVRAAGHSRYAQHAAAAAADIRAAIKQTHSEKRRDLEVRSAAVDRVRRRIVGVDTHTQAASIAVAWQVHDAVVAIADGHPDPVGAAAKALAAAAASAVSPAEVWEDIGFVTREEALLFAAGRLPAHEEDRLLDDLHVHDLHAALNFELACLSIGQKRVGSSPDFVSKRDAIRQSLVLTPARNAARDRVEALKPVNAVPLAKQKSLKALERIAAGSVEDPAGFAAEALGRH